MLPEFKSKTYINFNVILIRCCSFNETVFTQTSLLSDACPEILTLVITIVQLHSCLLLILQVYPYSVTDLEKNLTLLWIRFLCVI